MLDAAGIVATYTCTCMTLLHVFSSTLKTFSEYGSVIIESTSHCPPLYFRKSRFAPTPDFFFLEKSLVIKFGGLAPNTCNVLNCIDLAV